MTLAADAKFKGDLVWNLGALAISGAGGILLNVLIGLTQGPNVLGIFNQVFAAYLASSQLAALGVHFSSVKHLAEKSAEPRQQGVLITTALLAVWPPALITTAVFALSAAPVAAFFDSPGVRIGMLAAAPGLFLFAVNKVLMAVLNGLRMMRLYAVLQVMRFGFMLLGFYGLVLTQAPPATFAGILSIAELAVCCVALPAVWRCAAKPSRAELGLVRTHLRFGVRSFSSGLLIELNTRIDVLVLGFLLDDRTVGLYSFAAMLAEGFLQVLVVLRTNYNPILTRLLTEGRYDELTLLMQRGVRRTYVAAAVVGGLSVVAYPLVLKLVGGANYLESWPLFALLMLGIVASSGYMPFGFLLLQAGFPGWHSLTVGLSVAFNLLGNALLVIPFGATGAAVATGASFVLSVVLLKVVSRQRLPVRL